MKPAKSVGIKCPVIETDNDPFRPSSGSIDASRCFVYDGST